METEKENTRQDSDIDEDKTIEEGFARMELLWKSRCVKMPTLANVTVREIKKEQ